MNDPDLFRLIANPHFLAKERIVKKKENNYLENHIHTKYPKLYVTPQLLKEIEVSIDKIINDRKTKGFANDFLQSCYQKSIQNVYQKI